VPIAHPFKLEPSESRLKRPFDEVFPVSSVCSSSIRIAPSLASRFLVSSTCLDCRLLVPLRDSVPAHVITPLTEQSISFASFTTLLTDVTTFFLSTTTTNYNHTTNNNTSSHSYCKTSTEHHILARGILFVTPDHLH
jgi:hypothetical protein